MANESETSGPDTMKFLDADPARERMLAIGNGWSSGFVENLAAARADVEAQRAMKSLRVAVSANRTRKSPLGS